MSALRDENDVVLLENGTQYFPALEAAIDLASCEIYLETYIYEDDQTSRRITNALSRAAKRGVRVRVLVDGFGGRSFVAGPMGALQAAGVTVLIYRQEIRLISLRRHRLRRLHRKLVVIDARVAFVGGINILDDLTEGGPLQPRFDYAVRVEGPVVAQIVATVRRMWRLVSWAHLRRREKGVTHAPLMARPAGKVRAGFVIRDNLGHRRDIEDAYLRAIHRAREEVVIASAYFFPGRRFRRALTLASRRGVRVILLLQGLSDHPLLAYATRALYPYFLGRGIRLFEYHRSYLHAKVAVVDCHWATVGSSNIDPFSLLLAREANLVIEDHALAQQLRDSLAIAMRDGAVELRSEEWGRLPVLKRAATWFSYQFVRLAIGIAGFRSKH